MIFFHTAGKAADRPLEAGFLAQAMRPAERTEPLYWQQSLYISLEDSSMSPFGWLVVGFALFMAAVAAFAWVQVSRHAQQRQQPQKRDPLEEASPSTRRDHRL